MKWDWDPTKWLIWFFHNFTNQIPTVKRTPVDEVERARERVKAEMSVSKLTLTGDMCSLPVVCEGEVEELYKERPVIVLDGYIVDVESFSHIHPGGKQVLQAGYGGRDLSKGFRELNHHSRHARDLVESMRIAKVVAGGTEIDG